MVSKRAFVYLEKGIARINSWRLQVVFQIRNKSQIFKLWGWLDMGKEHFLGGTRNLSWINYSGSAGETDWNFVIFSKEIRSEKQKNHSAIS